MPRLSGKLALITGGNSGIGLATAKAFVAEGARVAITGLDPDALESARRSIGNDTLALVSDVADLNAIDALVAAIRTNFGALDILFANAGVGTSVPVENTTEEEFDRVFNVNVKGLFFTVQKTLPLLRNGASIILKLDRDADRHSWTFGVRCKQGRSPYVCSQFFGRVCFARY